MKIIRTLDLAAQVLIDVPRVPNFIKLNGNYVPLSSISDDNLEEVGRAWAENLKIRAAQQREHGVE